MAEVHEGKEGSFPPRLVKIFGDRNTCTRLLSSILAKAGINLTREGSYFNRSKEFSAALESILGCSLSADEKNRAIQLVSDLWDSKANPVDRWKHAETTYTMDFASRNVFTIFTVKHPVFWIASLYRRPYDSLNPKPSSKEMRVFLRSPWIPVRRENGPACYANPMELWNRKTYSYLTFASEAKKNGLPVHIINAERLIMAVDEVLRELEHVLDLPEGRLEPEIKSTKEEGKTTQDYREYYGNEEWRARFDEVDIAYLHEHINWELAAILGYSPEIGGSLSRAQEADVTSISTRIFQADARGRRIGGSLGTETQKA